MGHFANVNGVHREIVGGRTSIDGIEREITLGKTSVNGIEYDIPFNRVIGKLPVGTSVYANFNGELKEFIIVQQGLPSSMYSETCNDTWLLMKDIYDNMMWRSVINYPSFEFNTLSNQLLPLFGDEIKDKIKQVKIPYYTGRNKNAVYTGEDGMSVKLFFLSAKELGLDYDPPGSTNPNPQPDDGTLLSYFDASYNDYANQKRIAYWNYQPWDWWTRSIVTPGSSTVNKDQNAIIVKEDGTDSGEHIFDRVDYGDGSYATSSAKCGVRPAFILPSETLVNYKYHILP